MGPFGGFGYLGGVSYAFCVFCLIFVISVLWGVFLGVSRIFVFCGLFWNFLWSVFLGWGRGCDLFLGGVVFLVFLVSFWFFWSLFVEVVWGFLQGG